MARMKHDWYLREWLGALKMSQADLVRATGYTKAKVSELVTGHSRYNRDVIDVISKAINLQPYEMLMHPDEAMSLRQLKLDALRIVEHSYLTRTGTEG